jgi:hypothetical protein
MGNTGHANLRRARSRRHFRLHFPAEPNLAQFCRDLVARTPRLAPELELPIRFHSPNPVFSSQCAASISPEYTTRSA